MSDWRASSCGTPRITSRGFQLAYEPPRPGDPAALLDWRWLARPLAGERRVSNDPWGKRRGSPLWLPGAATQGRAYQPADGGFVALDVTGPGVLDHLWAPVSAGTRLAIEVDGKPLWQGPFGLYVPPDRREAGLFPE